LKPLLKTCFNIRKYMYVQLVEYFL
jgi:hypothetical protein